MNSFLWSNIFKGSSDEIQIIADRWRNTPLFRNIPSRHIHQLAENMHPRSFRQGETVFREGDQGAGAILIVEGQVHIKAQRNHLATLEPGDFFGEIALAETDKRTADAVCESDCRLAFFLRQDLEEWIETEPRLGAVFLMNLASVLAQRLHQANLKLAHEKTDHDD